MITLDDLIDRFGEMELATLSDRENRTTIDEQVINRAINDAVAEVNSYLSATPMMVGGVYQGQVPKALTVKACDIARYYLYDDGVTEIVKERYHGAIDYLKLVVKNPSMLGGDSATPPTTMTGSAVLANPKPNYWIE